MRRSEPVPDHQTVAEASVGLEQRGTAEDDDFDGEGQQGEGEDSRPEAEQGLEVKETKRTVLHQRDAHHRAGLRQSGSVPSGNERRQTSKYIKVE